MQIFTSDSPLEWGALDLPLLGVTTDWYGQSLNPPIAFTVATDPDSFWFVATRQAPATSLPESQAHKFTPELWTWDVAEFFLADATGKQYLELNIAPNGAWWAAKFTDQRIAATEQPDFESQIKSYCDNSDSDTWVVALQIPLSFLQEIVSFGPDSRGNATFIMNSPEQTFHTAAKLPGAEPDFHQPTAFPKLIPSKLSAS